MTISTLGTIHMIAALAALALGLVVLLNPKGTPLHRLLGAGFVAALVTVNLSSFGIVNINGHFGPFHILAAVSLFTLARGILAVIRRRPGWLVTHYRAMCASYIALVSAAAAEAMIHIPATRALLGDVRTGVIASLCVIAVIVVVGRMAVYRFERRALGRFAAS